MTTEALQLVELLRKYERHLYGVTESMGERVGERFKEPKCFSILEGGQGENYTSQSLGPPDAPTLEALPPLLYIQG